MSDEENKRRMDENRRKYEEGIKKESEQSSSSLHGYTPPALLQTRAERLAPVAQTTPPSSYVSFQELIRTPQQIRFTEPYGSREPFSSPLPIGSELRFNVPYGSRQPFGSPQPPFDPSSQIPPPPPSRDSSLRPRRLYERFESIASDTPTTGSQIASADDWRMLSQQSRPNLPSGTTDSGYTLFAPPRPSSHIIQPRQSSTTDSTNPWRQQTEPSVRPKISQQLTQERQSQATSGTTPSLTDWEIEALGGRRYSTGDITSDLTERMGDLSMTDPSNPWHQQIEQTLKIPTPLQPRGSPPPPISNETPEPVIVGRYSDPITGEPDPQKLQQKIKWKIKTGRRDLDLTNLSRHQTREIQLYHAQKGRRKRDYLESRGFVPHQYDIPGRKQPLVRYESGQFPRPVANRQTLVPRRYEDAVNLTDPRFNKPLSRQDKVPIPNPLAPIGRQSYGPLPRRAMSLPDLSSPNLGEERPQSNLDLFRERFSEIKPKHQNYYKEYQQQIAWHQNPSASDRKVKAPTIMSISDSDKSQLNVIRDKRSKRLETITDARSARQQRRERRKSVGEDSVLTPAIEDEKKRDWLAKLYFQPIPEENEEDSDDDEDESDDK